MDKELVFDTSNVGSSPTIGNLLFVKILVKR